MTDIDRSSADVEERVKQSGEVALFENAMTVSDCLRSPPTMTWMFFGACAMPTSEHLIPCRI